MFRKESTFQFSGFSRLAYEMCDKISYREGCLTLREVGENSLMDAEGQTKS